MFRSSKYSLSSGFAIETCDLANINLSAAVMVCFYIREINTSLKSGHACKGFGHQSRTG